MAEDAPVEPVGDDVVGDELTPGYKAPKQKSLSEITDLDADDESLIKYKATLLAGATDVLDEGGNNVIVKKLAFSTDGREDVELDLTGDLKELAKKKFVMKEGVSYKIRIFYRVQREIVAGLRYVQSIYRKGIRVDKLNLMVGSYGPKTDAHIFSTPSEDVPSGLMSRGSYTVKSVFTDDDKNIYCEWSWCFDVKKEWE